MPRSNPEVILEVLRCVGKRGDGMSQIRKVALACIPAALIMFANDTATAGKTRQETGAFACFNDKWDEKELEKGHKVVDYAGRCVHIPDDPAEPKSTQDCVGKYEYLPDETWKASGTCTHLFKDGDKKYETWEEGSHLKEYASKITGGTGKYQRASGDFTYTYDNLTDTLAGGRYAGTLRLP
ncbi:MAG: hypothetical protein WDN31_22875 [Hyphomicrobium sp.]